MRDAHGWTLWLVAFDAATAEDRTRAEAQRCNDIELAHEAALDQEAQLQAERIANAHEWALHLNRDFDMRRLLASKAIRETRKLMAHPPRVHTFQHHR